MCHPACVGEDGPDGEDRVLAHAKSNSGALAPSLRYRIEGMRLSTAARQSRRVLSPGLAMRRA